MSSSSLNQDPNAVTQALLQALVLSAHNSSVTFTPSTLPIPVWAGPSVTVIWIQSLLYVSLACSLFAALAAVLGKQWLSHYRSVGERGDAVTRGRERHRKYVGLETWHLRTILATIPLLLQLSLLLFGLGLCAYIWDQQRVVGAVAIVVNGIGALFYVMAVGVSVVYKDSPFQTPVTTIITRLTEESRPALTYVARLSVAVPTGIRSRIGSLLAVVVSMLQWFMQRMRRLLPGRHQGSEPHNDDEERACSSELTDSLDSESIIHLNPGLSELLDFESIKSAKTSSSSLDTEETRGTFELSEQDDLPASAVLWLLNTTTDAQIQATIWRIIPTIPWSPQAMQNLPVNVLDRVLVDVRACFELDQEMGLQVIPRHREAALSTISVFLFLFWEKLGDSYDETKGWVRKTHAKGALDIFRWLYYLDLPAENELYYRPGSLLANNELWHLLRHLVATIKHLCQYADAKEPAHPLHPVTSVRSHLFIGVDILCARTAFYLATQVAPPSATAISSWDAQELRTYRGRILRLVSESIPYMETIPALAMLTLASVASADPSNLYLQQRLIGDEK